jgi:SP family sugar:H+ symporter-like MFS transporter
VRVTASIRSSLTSFSLTCSLFPGLSLVQVDELYLTKVPAWRSANWTPYGSSCSHRTLTASAETDFPLLFPFSFLSGGATKRNAVDEAKALKLGTSASHHENAPAKRDLSDDQV